MAARADHVRSYCGAEFLTFRGDLICEVRAYYARDGDLVGFDHAGRGHTVLPR